MVMRIGILGCARIAKAAMIDAAPYVPGLTVAAIAARDGIKAAAFARAHGIARSHTGYTALLADPHIDAVYVPLPNSLHAHWSIAALAEGKAVLCEKPLSANAAEARQMADAARKSGPPLMEAVHFRFHPLARFVDGVLAQAELGEIEEADAGFEVPGALVERDNIRFDAALAGGAMMDVGSYGMHALRWVTGEEPKVEWARAQLLGPHIDCTMRARFAFPGGARGTLVASLAANELRTWLHVRGTRGALRIDNPFLPHLGHRLVLERPGQPLLERSYDKLPSYVYQARAFVDVVRHRAKPLLPLADSVATMAAIDAVYAAAGLAPRGSAGRV